MITLADCYHDYGQIARAKLVVPPDLHSTLDDLQPLLEMVYYAGALGTLCCLDEVDEDIWPARLQELGEEIRRRVAAVTAALDVGR
jgi:hypothetical protein